MIPVALEARASFRFVETLPRQENDSKQCARPTLLQRKGLVPGTTETIQGRCKSGLISKCRYCASFHRQNLRTIIASGFQKETPSDKPLGVEFITLTGGGAKVLPWDKAKCNHLPSLKCSGAIGCKANEIDTAVYNEEMKKRWNWLVTDLERVIGKELPYWKCYETQSRGVLHIHAIMKTGSTPHKHFADTVKRLAKKWGFGSQTKVIRITTRNKGAISAYVGKYVTKGSEGAQTVNMRTGEIKVGGYRLWSASRDYGLTMAQVKSDVAEFYRLKYLEAESVERLRDARIRGADGANATGDEVALDYLYEKLRT